MSMSHDEIRTKLAAVLHRQIPFLLDGRDIPWDEPLADLGLDSMAAINTVIDIEHTFAVLVPDEMLIAATFRTAATLENAIRVLVRDQAES